VSWIEVTGRTIAEAKDLALDRLGVDERDAEFEIIDEAETGWFGRVKRDARVRARVRPEQPRQRQQDRRSRQRQRRGKGDDRGPRPGKPTAGAGDSPPAGRDNGNGNRNGNRRPRNRRPAAGGGATLGNESNAAPLEETVSLEAQATIAVDFMKGLTNAFGFEANVSWREDDGTAEVNVEGQELGLLIGPKGRTLQAINEVARSVVLRQLDHAPEGRLTIDVAHYRQRRREALERFARSIADEVTSSGQARALEPMSASDRKIVHDAVSDIAGVRTSSEGEDPDRHVVISPAS